MSLQARSHAQNLTMDETLRGTLAIGILEAEGVKLDPLPREFLDERDRVVARLVGQFAGKQPADIPGVAETRTMFHRLDIDPTKTRPSSEALLRRVLQGKGMPEVNAIVDVANLCSLDRQLPLGLYDRDKIKGAIEVRVGRDRDGYAGIRKKRVNLAGRLLLADESGPFGAPTSDSQRTSTTSRTKNLLLVVFCPPERAAADLSGMLERAADLLKRHCGADIVAVRTIQ